MHLHSQYIKNTVQNYVRAKVWNLFQDWLTIVTVVFWSEMQLRLAQKRLGVRNLRSLGKVLSGATTTEYLAILQ